MGRPTKYLPEYIDKVDEYLATRQDEEYRLVKSDGEKSTTWENKIRVKLPTIGGFALFIDTPERTVYEWRDKHDKFSQSLDKIVKKQRERLLDSGLSGDYNSTIAKLILSSNHGMVERKDVTSDGKELPTPILYVPNDDSNAQDSEDD